MIKYLTLSLIVTALAAGSAFAEEKNDWSLKFPENKEHFVKAMMAQAKKKQDPKWNPTEKGLQARFDALDTNKDGKLTQEEWNARDAGKGKGKQNGKKKE